MIRVKNIYYMLSYAYSILKKDEYKAIATEDFNNIADLFSAILSAGIANQIKRGLHREYVEKNESLSVPVGKINISSSLRKLSILQRQLVCSYDNLTENTYCNMIIKKTAMLLIKSTDVRLSNRKSLKKSLLYFSNVNDISIKNIKWSNVSYQRNNASYKMLINLCYLVISGLLLTDTSGNSKFMNYLDDQNMYRLYEKFVLNFYKKHYPQYNPRASYIKWNIDDGFIDFLPAMKSDITLSYEDKMFIIDTKYYRQSMQNNVRYDKTTVHSSNLYQIYAYVKNSDINNKGNVTGALLYAKTDASIQPNYDYSISGNRILVKTLDLDSDFEYISQQLNNLVDTWHSPTITSMRL